MLPQPREDFVRFVVDHRVDALTPLVQACSFLGTVEGYVLVITLVFAARHKALAYRLTAVALVAMSANHVLKTVLTIPRPFIGDGTYAERWAVWGEDTAQLAGEFSTPSGHAMAAAAFYGFLVGRARTARARLVGLAVIGAIGLSRPYLGVHYFEDVALGWALGGALAYLAVRHEPAIVATWRRIGHARQIGGVVAGGAAMWALTSVLTPKGADHPLAYLSYAGFLLGAVVGFPLESRHVRFDPASGSALQKGARWLLAAAVVLVSLEGLEAAFATLAAEESAAGQVLRYLRYALVAATTTVAAPALMVRLRLAARERLHAFA